MTSERKLWANRQNAKRSTGPTTAAGKARSSRNARRHGLSARISSDPRLAAEADDLARRIAGDQPNKQLMQSSRAVAEAECDIARARQFRLDILQGMFPAKADAALPAEQSRTLIRTDLPGMAVTDQDGLPGLQPADPALAYDAMTKQLEAADRYERRALSRRKFAIRAFDEARLPAIGRTRNSPLLGIKS